MKSEVRRPEIGDRRRETGDGRPETGDRRPASYSLFPFFSSTFFSSTFQLLLSYFSLLPPASLIPVFPSPFSRLFSFSLFFFPFPFSLSFSFSLFPFPFFLFPFSFSLFIRQTKVKSSTLINFTFSPTSSAMPYYDPVHIGQSNPNPFKITGFMHTLKNTE